MEVIGLRQIITNPTRISSSSSSLTDVILTSTPNVFSKSGAQKNLISDRIPIYGIIPSLKQHHKYYVITTRSQSDGCYSAFEDDIKNIPWAKIKGELSIDKKVQTWTEFFSNVLNKHFPLRKKRIRQNTYLWI